MRPALLDNAIQRCPCKIYDAFAQPLEMYINYSIIKCILCTTPRQWQSGSVQLETSIIFLAKEFTDGDKVII